MKMNKLLWIALLTGFLVVIGIYGYNNWFAKASGNEISIAKDSADALKVDIDFGVGNLLVHGNSSDWVSGDFTYNHKRLEPSVKYKKKKDVGFVTIKQGSKSTFGFNKRKLKNDWDLQLTNDVPIDLDVDMGVSKSRLKLEGLQLNSLSIDSGVSDSVIDLSGAWSKGFRADVDLGVGDVTLILPKETGVRLTVSKGLGRLDLKDFIKQNEGVYVNEAYEDADIIIDLFLDIGVGDVKFMIAE
ncbi:toast rack family protein [Sporosarcina sp. Marseille-Q4943]|uniref:toast rack family protein n=1 Tax=Sporosarcina sp. Marseille-Q4943 TaxID=2942204 RepID=UPI00208DCE17|nr:toast rack family protein [Sporosarcina sp. Marseille-Q4943]